MYEHARKMFTDKYLANLFMDVFLELKKGCGFDIQDWPTLYCTMYIPVLEVFNSKVLNNFFKPNKYDILTFLL